MRASASCTPTRDAQTRRLTRAVMTSNAWRSALLRSVAHAVPYPFGPMASAPQALRNQRGTMQSLALALHLDSASRSAAPRDG